MQKKIVTFSHSTVLKTPKMNSLRFTLFEVDKNVQNKEYKKRGLPYIYVHPINKIIWVSKVDNNYSYYMYITTVSAPSVQLYLVYVHVVTSGTVQCIVTNITFCKYIIFRTLKSINSSTLVSYSLLCAKIKFCMLYWCAWGPSLHIHTLLKYIYIQIHRH